jgi:hypothetical protein
MIMSPYPSQNAAALSGSARSISSDDSIATTGMTAASSGASATLAVVNRTLYSYKAKTQRHTGVAVTL